MLLLFFLYFIYSVGAFIIIFLIIFNVLPYFFGAPFVPSSDRRTRTMMKLLKPRRGEKIVDLGSGDGKLLFEIAKRGALAYGFEINPILVWRTRRKIKELGLEKKVFVKRSNFFKEDLSKFDAVIFYGITYIVKRLEKKLLAELKPGARVLSNFYKFPNWQPTQKEGEILLYSSTSTFKSK